MRLLIVFVPYSQRIVVELFRVLRSAVRDSYLASSFYVVSYHDTASPLSKWSVRRCYGVLLSVLDASGIEVCNDPARQRLTWRLG